MSTSKTAITGLLACLFAWGQNASKVEVSEGAAPGQLRIPSRSAAPLFEGQQGNQNTEIRYDPATRTVTLKLLVQDPSGYFIPNIRRENFAVYENNVRQQNVSVEVEHATVSLALLMENGGRYPSLNKIVTDEAARAARQLLDVLGRQDKVALLLYGDSVKELAGFSQARDTLEMLLYDIKPPDVSEANLYDAVIFALGRMRPVDGRKAMILISSGIDTFSKATIDDAVSAAKRSGIPIYCINLARAIRQSIGAESSSGPMARIDWAHAENALEKIATASGGRTYSPLISLDLSTIYDDIMENLRVRYVITYKSITTADENTPRMVRVELVDPKTGGTLQVVDSNGKTVPTQVIVQDSYTPAKAAKGQ